MIRKVKAWFRLRRDMLLQGLIGVSWGNQTGKDVATENALHVIDFRTTQMDLNKTREELDAKRAST